MMDMLGRFCYLLLVHRLRAPLSALDGESNRQVMAVISWCTYLRVHLKGSPTYIRHARCQYWPVRETSRFRLLPLSGSLRGAANTSRWSARGVTRNRVSSPWLAKSQRVDLIASFLCVYSALSPSSSITSQCPYAACLLVWLGY